jgi:VanZ family protein
MKKIFSLWLPVGFWMGIVFYLSSIPNLRVSQSNFWDETLRSGAHFILYGIGYFLFFRAINFDKENLPAGKAGKNFLLPLFLTFFYGFFDEIHQSFVPTRSFQIQDLIVDFSGAFLAKIILEEKK